MASYYSPGAQILVNAAELNRLTNKEIAAWIDSRFLGYDQEKVFDPNKLKKDSRGFPLGVTLDHIGDFSPLDYLKDAYRDGSPQFRESFESNLRKKLEERITDLDLRQLNTQSLNYLNFGLSLIGFSKIDPLADVAIKCTDQKYDFDFNAILNPECNGSTGNLYTTSISSLSLLSKTGLSHDFWDRFLKDPRVGKDALAPLSFSPIERVRRVIKHYEKVEYADIPALMCFGDYIIVSDTHGNRTIFSTTEMGKRKEEVDRLILENASEPLSAVLLKISSSALEIAIEALKWGE